jgi:hypothetical protein
MITYLENGISVDGEFISIGEINEKVNLVKIKAQKLAVVHIEWDGGRGFDGCKESITLPKANAEKLIDLITGKYCYFGEIAGKHSEVYGDIDKDDITLITDEKSVNEWVSKNSMHTYDHSFIYTIEQGIEQEGDDIDEVMKQIHKLIN